MMNTCGSCRHRDHEGWCKNETKLHEDWGNEKEDKTFNNDHLIYCYTEGGGFKVGKNFGCIHWEKLK